MADNFADRLIGAIEKKTSPICVGIDPIIASMPDAVFRGGRDKADGGDPQASIDAIFEFTTRVLKLVAPHVPCVKFQSAYFEQFHYEGVEAYFNLIQEAAELGLLVIGDVKRGDIASTAAAYADAAFGPVWDADSLTINPYLGRDAVEPFLSAAKAAGRGVFVLVRTSNAGAGLFQDLVCDGKPLYRHVAAAVAEWNAATLGACGLGDVGAVVGATHPRELAELRAALPNVWFLVPGYGAQGATAADVKAAYRADGLGAVVNSSRGVTFPFHPDDPAWESKVTAAARRAAAELA